MYYVCSHLSHLSTHFLRGDHEEVTLTLLLINYQNVLYLIMFLKMTIGGKKKLFSVDLAVHLAKRDALVFFLSVLPHKRCLTLT